MWYTELVGVRALRSYITFLLSLIPLQVSEPDSYLLLVSRAMAWCKGISREFLSPSCLF